MGSRRVGRVIPVSPCYREVTLASPMEILLHPRPSVHGEEPYPTRGDPVTQNTADLKE